MKRARHTIAGYLNRHGVSVAAVEAPGGRSLGCINMAGGRKYVLRRKIAQGGMGVVYEAEDVNCRRAVALKLLSSKWRPPVGDVVRFIEEAQVTSRLEHPNIIPIHELGMDVRGRVFYTMKHIKGRTLGDVLRHIRHGDEKTLARFPLSRLLNVFQKVCDAVAFAHANNVVHSDIKPDNIMVGDYGEVVLTDWGLARSVPNPEAHSRKETRRGRRSRSRSSTGFPDAPGNHHVMGSLGFMAPEQIHLGAEVGVRSDIYGLGAILYNILALRPTVTGRSMMAVLKRVVTGSFPPPAAFNDVARRKRGRARAGVRWALPHCPDGLIPEILSDIAMKALSADPENRFPAVKMLQEEIEAYQSGLVWMPVIDEDFTEPGVEQRWDIVGGSWEIRDGELCIHGGEPQLMVLKTPVPGDVRIEFECRQESIYLNDVSCFMNAIPARELRDTAFTGYEFKYGGFENSLILLIRNDIRLLAQGASPIERGKTYRVCAERIGSRLRLRVNDREIFNIVDQTPLSGPDRTAVGLYGWRATTVYGRIRVYSLRAPWRSDLLDFADRQIQKGSFAVAESLYREIMDAHHDSSRSQRAQDGLVAVRRYRLIQDELPLIRKRLERAWPGRKFQLAVDHDGLALDLTGCDVSDLSPLRGLPLRSLNCQYNHIRTLEPLRGLKLATLNCAGNPVTSLEPLKGMPLHDLVCECCRIGGLEPLKDMPLQLLSIGNNPLGSLEAIRGLPITNLYVWNTGISSLAPLKSMSVVTLDCYANRISDLGPLAGMQLATLNCESNGIRNLAPLNGAPLKVLHCGQNEISELEPLKGGRLFHFTCACNRIRSLKPLNGMPLGRLICGNNRLTALDPFIDAPPEVFQYECETLPRAEVEKAMSVWARRRSRVQLFKEAKILLALRTGELGKLREMASAAGKRSYLYIPKLMTWDAANAFCKKLGGNLVVIRSQEEHDFLLSLYPAAWAWMGLRMTSRGLRWVTGEPVAYTRFAFHRDQIAPGPKVFARRWSYQSQPGYENPFIIEWKQ